MAGYTIERAKQIIHDFGNSWYFRFWALFWLIAALVTFSALIILSGQARNSQKDKDIEMWVENASEIQFPRFHFRMDHRGSEVFLNLQCQYGDEILQTHDCQSFHGFQPPQNQCLAIWADEKTVKNDWNRPNDRIQCTMETQGSGPQGNLIMAFDLEGEHVFGFTGGAFESTWFAPNDNAWIMLEKNLLQASKHDFQITLWDKTLLYHSTQSQPNYYNVTVIIGSFFVNHWDPKVTYNGWMTVGNIGGVAFFMVCIQTIAMIVFGIFLSNTSTFLNGTGDKGY